MLIGILETGRVNAALAERHGEYPKMFEGLFRSADPALHFRTFPVLEGVLPQGPEAADAWIVTGSKWGVYDDIPWIAPLTEFLRQVRAAKVPLVGICFGHQLMAMAFGGRAEKSGRGWGAGVHRYTPREIPSWMADGDRPLAFHAMHQDQVTAVPEDATVIASSDFCPYAMLAYGDLEAPEAISIQPHPEFDAPYGADLVRVRTGVAVPEDIAAAALETYGSPVDNAAFARWAVAYIKLGATERSAA